MAKKKTLLEKAGEAVEKIIHPQDPLSEPRPVQDPSAQAEAQADSQLDGSSPEKNDYQQHPKFAKFNSQGSETP